MGPGISYAQTTVTYKLLLLDNKCAVAAAKIGTSKRWERSVNDIDKRVDPLRPNRPTPGNILFSQPGWCEVVDGGAARYLLWSQRSLIGTIGLCGCTAIAITGEFGAIVAHINPNLETFYPQMNALRDLFRQNIQGQTAQVYLLGPSRNGAAMVPQFTTDAYNYITHNIGLPIVRTLYEVGNVDNRDQARLGTLLVQLWQNALYVWVNNVKIN